MSTVTFEIAPSYIAKFLKARNIKGGCVVPARKVDTGELGALLVCHTPSVSKWESQLNKIKWIVSCYCPFDDKSPFGGNINTSVKTEFNKTSGELVVMLKEEGEIEFADLEARTYDWHFGLTESNLMQLEVVESSPRWARQHFNYRVVFSIYWDYYNYYLEHEYVCYKLAGCHNLDEVQYFVETGELI
jgi:hypothetical protein